jgi:hypothetical protein
MIVVLILSNIHERNQIVSLTLRILLLIVPVGPSSCRASFVLLLVPDFWLCPSSPSKSLNLYILVSSLDEQHATRSNFELR